jgi:hypothetical protein
MRRPSMGKEDGASERLIRFCGAVCDDCYTYKRFLTGDKSGIVNPETGYRCCWIPKAYRKGKDCEIKLCCEDRQLLFCGECQQLEECPRMREFYSQPGYAELKERMLRAAAKIQRKGKIPSMAD